MTTTLNTTWDKTFPLSEKVIHEKVSYPNRYGITIAADMYKPADFDGSGSYAALIVGTPYGGVKEQGAGIYAQAMAERGFIAIAFDESYNGESGGTPRRVSSPDIFVEDFSAGVDFLGTRPFVDRERIGVTYEHAFSLMMDLRNMGETNAVHERRKTFSRRQTLIEAAEIYLRRFADRSGRLHATFDVICLTGWAPDESQPKPLRPGSAAARLADALGGKEEDPEAG